MLSIRSILTKFKTVYYTLKYIKNPVRVMWAYIIKGEAEIETKNSKLIVSKEGNLNLKCLVRALAQGWRVERKNNEYIISKEGITLKQPVIGPIHEPLEDIYLVKDISGKVVLDIGGFLGETSILFIKEGRANKVIVFEPVPQHLKVMYTNIRVNNLQNSIEVYPYGVGDTKQEKLLTSVVYSGGFGLERGNDKVKIKLLPWSEVLDIAIKNNVYLAKIDCEGCEQHLISASCEKIKKIPNWVIETHSNNIEENITRKFKSCGFKKRVIKVMNTRPRTVKIILFELDHKIRQETH